MAVEVLLDSVILIDHFNGIGEATHYLRRVHNKAAISVITRAEVLCGFDKTSFATAALFLDAFPTIGLDQSSADLAAEIRRVHRLRFPDAFQAAVARMRRLKLATRNTKDFPQGRFPFVVVPYSIP